MGNKQSNANKYLQPLPQIYEKNDISEVYSLKGFDLQAIIDSNKHISLISNPQTVTDQQVVKQHKSGTQHQERTSLSHQQCSSEPHSYNPPYLKHFTILLNKFQTRPYLNHLAYRNQPQFREFIVQMPFGQIQNQDKYTKVHLYVDQLVFTLNQLFNLPFYDMGMVLYTALLAYKYLYSYFGLFKIEANMIGFTREAKTKVWLNHKLTKDKPQPIVSDINLKRYKEEESYMVDDLLTIFMNKVDKQSIPTNFTLVNNASSIRASRATRLTYSRVGLDEADLSKSTVTSLENNLISDFSDCSFDKCLQYLEKYFYIQRPEFFVVGYEKAKHKIQGKEMQVNQPNQLKGKLHKNFIPSVFELIKTRKQFTVESSDLRTSRANTNINMRQITGMNQVSHFQCPQVTGLQFRKTNNQQNMAESIVRRPNIMLNPVPMKNSQIPQIHQTPVINQKNPKQQIRFTTSSYVPAQTSHSLNPPQQVNLNRSSKSKPKVTFNTMNTPAASLYQRISPNKVYNSAIVQSNSNNPNKSLQKRPIAMTPKSIHGSMVTPQTVNSDNDFSFRITTSQVQTVYTGDEDHQKELKPVLISQNINFKSGISSNWQHEDKHDKDSIIDGVAKV